MIAELQTGRIDAILDVTHPEVNDPGSALWDLPNVVLTPHIAGPLGVELQLLTNSAIDEIERALADKPLLHSVLESRYHALA